MLGRARCAVGATLHPCQTLTPHAWCPNASQVDDLRAVAADVDVLYQTRIQKERFQDRPQDYELAKGALWRSLRLR